ncbi:MAG: ribonuclease P protein component [Tannerellaceae bacterium]|jgi:ribonuclease P protein component|nr:ribonuclease P protein component [Tannerellaceae bacterium]
MIDDSRPHYPSQLPKSERLSFKRHVDWIFATGQSLFVYPIRIVYRPLADEEQGTTAILVSVSKRRFKHAVDRNRIKRLLREAYRLNKHSLPPTLRFHIAFLYIASDHLTFPVIQKAMAHALRTLNKKSQATATPSSHP